MRLVLIIILSFSSLYAVAQKGRASKHDTLRNVYKGTLPCADCSGLETELTLIHERHDGMGTFILKENYVDKGSFETKGTWSHHRGMYGNRNATVIELFNDTPDSDSRYYLQLKNGDLLMLDRQLKKINGPWNYTLKKVNSTVISNETKHRVVK